MTKARDLANASTALSAVSATELAFVDGVTSAIQTQIDTKLATATAATTYQEINANVSTTELGYLDGVTSAIQTQLDAKAPTSTTATLTGTQTLTNKTIDTASNTITGAATLTGTQTLTNKTLTSPIINTATATGAVLVAPEERTTVSATAATGTVNFDALTQGVLYYTSNTSGNWTLNVRGDGSNTLNSILATGDAITVSFLVTNGGTAYRHTAMTIDGTSVTPKWSGGSAPTAGNASSIDAYAFTIIKTASATYTVFGAGPVKYA